MNRSAYIALPFYFGLYPVIYLFVHNLDQLSFPDILIAVLSSIAFSLVLFVSSFLLTKEIKSASLYSTLVLILFFSFGNVFDIIEGFSIAGFVIGRVRYLYLIWLILFVTGVYFIKKKKEKRTTYVQHLWIMSAFLTIGLIIPVIDEKPVKVELKKGLTTESNTVPSKIESKVNYPDIYYIILDEYAGEESLKNIFEFNNESILAKLEAKGFYVAKDARSNYPITWMSLATSLNMKYLDEIIPDENLSYQLIYDQINESKVFKTVKDKGYLLYNFSSGYGPTNDLEAADTNLCENSLNEFNLVLLRSTILLPTQNHFYRYMNRSRINEVFKTIPRLKSEQPKFIFAHIVCPHFPFIFGKNGEYVNYDFLDGGEFWSNKNGYTDQLSYINTKIEVMVDEILENSVDPIIIIQADHGSCYLLGGSTEKNEGNWKAPTQEMQKERLEILNTFYVPDLDSSVVYNSITPINTFRIIFNTYFGTSYPLIEDKVYWATYGDPFTINPIK